VAEEFVVSVVWLGNYRFEARVGEFSVEIDQRKEEGGEGKGFKPTELLLSALAGCLMTNLVKILGFRNAKVLELEGKTRTVARRKFEISLRVKAERGGVELSREEIEEVLRAAEETCKISEILEEECKVSIVLV